MGADPSTRTIKSIQRRTLATPRGKLCRTHSNTLNRTIEAFPSAFPRAPSTQSHSITDQNSLARVRRLAPSCTQIRPLVAKEAHNELPIRLRPNREDGRSAGSLYKFIREILGAHNGVCTRGELLNVFWRTPRQPRDSSAESKASSTSSTTFSAAGSSKSTAISFVGPPGVLAAGELDHPNVRFPPIAAISDGVSLAVWEMTTRGSCS
jgi:hypothetical protein